MKKTLTVLASAVLALGMLFVTGCSSQATLNAEETPGWRHQLKGEKAETIELTADDSAINWWVVTNLDNEVIYSSKTAVAKDATYDIKFSPEDFKKDGKEEKSVKVVLWTNQKEAVAKDAKTDEEKVKGSRVFRGAITVRKGESVKIKASDYAESRQAVGTIVINNDETTNTKWHGTYEITKAVPLQLKEGKTDEYVLVGGLEIDANIKPGNEKEFVWPAGKSRLALRQPNRFNVDKTPAKDKENEKAAAAKQKDWYWTQEVDVPKFGKAKDAAKSSACDKAIPVAGGKLDGSKGDRTASTVLYYTEADFIDAADEK